MAEPNPMAVIAECIEKSEATADPELISDCCFDILQDQSHEHRREKSG
jgi:hypothetical protein